MTRPDLTPLPIDEALPGLIRALRGAGVCVLMAPPGAGKTTRVPLALLPEVEGRIVMLEPRRLAARAAAERMAETLGEPVGQTAGYRIRGETKVSKATRIEVVTEGILTRMLQTDPELSGIGCVIFDEFHERSLNADLGLALTWEVRGALREDLKLVVMSATLDAEPVAALLGDAPVVISEGRAFPVETRWLDRPVDKAMRLEAAVAGLIEQAVTETEGGVLVFLPGEGEIRRVEGLFAGRFGPDVAIRPLFGAMEFAAQRAAIRPAESGRKIVLATSIAETSLTIDGVRVVVDMGQSRRARFDPGSGMSRLVTEKVTRAEATQRQGRAGRVSEGICYRLWTKGEEGALAAFPPAEIASADLAGLALELALWGAGAGDLAFLTPPPEGALQEARNLLTLLGALDAQGRITTHGKALSALPLHPRLGHMLLRAGPDQAAPAATLAALLAERDPLRGAPSDLMLRLEALKDPKAFQRKRPYQLALPVVERIRAEARRLQQQQRKTRSDASVVSNLSAAGLAALAYPDRIGQRRKGDTPRYVLSGGKGAVLSPEDTLAAAPFLVALDTDGNPREAKIRMAVQIALADIRALFADQIRWQDSCAWSKRDRRVVARSQERLGSVVLDDRIWKDVPTEAIAEAMLDGVRDLGLRLSGAAARLVARVELLRADGHDLPDFSNDGLMATLDDWLLPMLTGVKTAQDWKQFDPLPALRAALSWEQTQLLDREAPGHFVTPLGRKIPIDYGEEVPEIAVRLQEMFGVTRHPAVGGVPLKVTLLSPAQRPIQITRDLPGFWAGSYADVRKDMRAQYPKHPWPEDPTGADPTLRANRRKS